MDDIPLTTSEAAEILDISIQGVLTAIKRKLLKAEKLGDERRGMWLIMRSEVERYKEERRPRGRPKEKVDNFPTVA